MIPRTLQSEKTWVCGKYLMIMFYEKSLLLIIFGKYHTLKKKKSTLQTNFSYFINEHGISIM